LEFLDASNAADKPTELEIVTQRINELRKQHLDDLDRLYESQAQDYLQEAMDKYLSKDDSQFLVKGENNLTAKLSYAKLDVRGLSKPLLVSSLSLNSLVIILQSLYEETRMPHSFAPEWDDAVDRLRVAYLKQLLPLQKRRAELESLAEGTRRQKEAQFPGSPEEYRAIRNKDVQMRIARFLTADNRKQESMMNQFGWAWRQVQPLKNEYQSDVSSCCCCIG